MIAVMTAITATQKVQYPLIREYASNHNKDP